MAKYEDHSKEFINDLEGHVLRPKMRLIGIAGKERAIALCFRKSGNLARSIDYKQIDDITVIITDGVKYGLKIELEYHPFLRRALRNGKPVFQRIMGQ